MIRLLPEGSNIHYNYFIKPASLEPLTKAISLEEFEGTANNNTTKVSHGRAGASVSEAFRPVKDRPQSPGAENLGFQRPPITWGLWSEADGVNCWTFMSNGFTLSQARLLQRAPGRGGRTYSNQGTLPTPSLPLLLTQWFTTLSERA